jgi:hypothetical protein
MNWKYILIVFILAAVVGGGILAYQYLWAPKEETMPKVKPLSGVSENETSDWKTYQNKKYGFEFRYPATLKLVEGALYAKDGVTLNTTGVLEHSIIYPRFQVAVDVGGTMGKVLSAENIKIGDRFFHKITFENTDSRLCGGSGFRGFEVRRAKILYKGFSTLYVQGAVCNNDASLLSTFEKIFATFRYTANAEIPDWKLYRNDKIGFEVKIPQGWQIIKEMPNSVSFYPEDNFGDAPVGGSVSVEENPSSDTLESIRKRLKLPEVKKLIVDGETAVYSEGEFATSWVEVIYQNKVYTISNELLLLEILSTFRFLD